MYIAKYPNSRREFIDYDALEHALSTANAEFRGKKVLTTMLGCSKFDGNGDKDKVLEIINRTANNLELDVYDYLQLEKRKEIALHFKKIKEFETTEPEKFNQLWPIRKELIKDLYLEF